MKTVRAGLCGFLSAVLLCMSMAAQGAVVAGLYEASVPVPDQSAAARSVALQQALAAVLVKITGERTAGGVPALANLIQDPSQFLQQYRYEQAPVNGSATPATYYDLTRTGAPAIAPTGLLLSAKFDPEVVNQAVRGAHEPLWGQERPVTLVWLALQEGSKQSIVSSGNNSTSVQAMNSAASQRGVTLIFPTMDAVDQQAIGFPDISNDITERIQQASRRYKPDAILVGNIYMTTPGQYAARWQLTAGAQSQSWTTPPADLASVAADGVQTTADHYAQWFAVAANALGTNGITVSVSGVTDVAAYAKVLAYLSGLTPVKSAQVTQVNNQTVYFSLDTRGDLSNLQHAVLLGGLLKPAASAAASSVLPTTASLQFQYVP
ncbi:MAG: DUF2066 domain-containing protein [Gammaproteobacteria bacterium]